LNERELTTGLISAYINTILLKIISLEDAYGYSISKKISIITDNMCELKEASMYSALRRLENEKLIESYWGEESQGGRRKYYRLTDEGYAELQVSEKKWELTKVLMDKIMGVIKNEQGIN